MSIDNTIAALADPTRRFLLDLPALVRIDFGLGIRITLQQKCRAVADHRERGVDSEIKDGRRHDVFSSAKGRRQVKRLVAPVL